MGTMEERLRELIIDSYGSIPRLAEAIGLPSQTIYSALRNGIVGASVATVMPIAAALNIDPLLLARSKVVRLPDDQRGYVHVPLYGSIAAGEPIEPITTNDFFPIPAILHESYPRAFLLKVSGESMNRILPDGCYALIEPCEYLSEPGQLYAVAIGESEATIKRVNKLANGIMLEPDSSDPTFKPRIFDFDDDTDETVSIIGRVVWFCPPFNWSLEQ